MKKPMFVAAAALSCALALGACSSGGSDAGSKTATPVSTTASASFSNTKSQTSSRGGVTTMPKLAGRKGVIKATTVKSCDVGPGAVKASGTVKNEAKKAQDIVVSVRWVAPKGNGIIDKDIAVIRQVPPGTSANWSASGDVPTKDKAVCSFSVVAGSIS